MECNPLCQGGAACNIWAFFCPSGRAALRFDPLAELRTNPRSNTNSVDFSTRFVGKCAKKSKVLAEDGGRGGVARGPQRDRLSLLAPHVGPMAQCWVAELGWVYAGPSRHQFPYLRPQSRRLARSVRLLGSTNRVRTTYPGWKTWVQPESAQNKVPRRPGVSLVVPSRKRRPSSMTPRSVSPADEICEPPRERKRECGDMPRVQDVGAAVHRSSMTMAAGAEFPPAATLQPLAATETKNSHPSLCAH